MSWSNDQRPSKLSEVIGQEVTIVRLQKTLNKINSDTFLFTGTKGTGKTSTARIVAKALNCRNKQNTEPCGECASCKSIANSMNPNVIEIDAASNRGINEAREIRQILQYSPPKNSYRIIILDEAHQLTKEAFNALLKSLEEIPDRNIVILCTTNHSAIPDTVLSRCKVFQFNPILAKDIISHLHTVCSTKVVKCAAEELEAIAGLSQGSLRNAIQLLEEAATVSDNDIKAGTVRLISSKTTPEKLDKAINCTINGNSEQKLLCVEELTKNGTDHRLFLNDLLIRLRDLIVISELSKPEIIIQNKDIIDSSKEFLRKTTITSESLQEFLESIVSRLELLNLNIAPRLVLEMCMLDL